MPPKVTWKPETDAKVLISLPSTLPFTNSPPLALPWYLSSNTRCQFEVGLRCTGKIHGPWFEYFPILSRHDDI